MLTEISRNAHKWEISGGKRQKEQWVFIAPDIHWDNPKCNLTLLKKHMDEAVKMGARIILPGDTFCLMQGKYDPRGTKSDIRPEHNVIHYIDAVIETAAEWFAPYQEYIDVVGLGNHESSILRRLETSVIDRFVQAINLKAKGDHRVCAGGYGGWYMVNFMRLGGSSTTYRIKYYHGHGGAAPVTKGTIGHNRMATQVEGADCIVQGHVHNDYEVTYRVEYLDSRNVPKTKDVLMVRCSTYKDEFKDGHSGWSVEMGHGPRPLGGRFLCISCNHRKRGSNEIVAYTRRAV